MRDPKWKNVDSRDQLGFVRMKDVKANGRKLAAIHEPVQFINPLQRPRWASDRQRLIARILMEIAYEKEWQTAKVIAMEMAQKNDIQPTRIEARPFHGQQARRPAIHEEKPVGGLNEISALVAPAVTKSITAAENMKFHDFILRNDSYDGPFAKASFAKQPNRPICSRLPFRSAPKFMAQHRSFGS
jgi:hypothetical protein